MADVGGKVSDIRMAIYGEQVREALASGIEVINDEVMTTTGKQGELETVFDNLVINAGSENAEIVASRGSEASLPIRLSKSDEQLAQTAKQADVRLKAVKLELEDASPTLLSAIEGGEGTSFNLLSIPQDDSTTLAKLDPNLRNEYLDVKNKSSLKIPNVVPNGDFSNGAVGWATASVNIIDVSANVLTYIPTSKPDGTYQQNVSRTTLIKANNIYYMSAEIYGDTSVSLSFTNDRQNVTIPNTWQKLSRLYTRTTDLSRGFGVYDNKTADWTETKVKNIMLFNLTEIFGVGNEPTKVEMDELTDKWNHSKQEIKWYDWIEFKTNSINIEEIADNKTYYFPPDDIVGHYEPQLTAFNQLTVDSTLQDVYDKYENLETLYPNYISKTLLGMDESNTYPIYQYRLKKEQITALRLTKSIPKVMFTNGIHGYEIDSIYSFYYLVEDLCKNWSSDPLLEYIHQNVEIVFIPVASPWTFVNRTRRNVNGVDINRNFPENWVQGETTSSSYGGPAPLSEAETRHIVTMIDANTDAIYYGDIHTNNSTGDVYSNLMWHSLNYGRFEDENIDISSRQLISKMTREFIKKYNQPDNEGYFGYITNQSGAGYAKVHGAFMGIPSSTIECFRKFPNQTDLHNPESLKACTEYFGNWIVTLLKQNKNTY